MTPQISIGFGTGIYIKISQADQRALLSGGIAFVAGSICATTAGIACVVAGSIAAAGLSYITTYGLCPDNGALEVKISYSGTVQSAKCIGD